MRWMDRLSMAQRVVIVVALGLALGLVASYLSVLACPVRQVRWHWGAVQCIGCLHRDVMCRVSR